MAEKLITVGSPLEAAEQKNSDAAFLAGGTEINRLDSFVSAKNLISIRNIKELKGIKKDGDFVEIGAMSTFQEVVDCDLVPDYMKDACKFMVSRTKRNMATVAGNVAMLRDDSYTLATLLAVDAKVKLLGADGKEEQVDVKDFVQSASVNDDKLILGILIPADVKFAMSKRYSNTAESHSYLVVSVAGNSFDDLKVAAAIKNSGIFCIDEIAEKIASNHDISEEEIIQWSRDWKGADVKSDQFGSEDYKRYLLGVTISIILDKARGGDL